MLSCNMISRLWIVMTIAINNAYIVSGEPRRYPRRLSRSCEAHNVDNPCQNGGRCHVTVSAGDAAEPALVTCRCTPAWTGVTCELERDPCTDGSAVCGPGWSCVRNSSNTAAGYDCGCGARSGWQRLADGLPRCVDIDECALLAPACFNGGQCRNRAGSYECLCKPGFTGRRCGESDGSDGWTNWGLWSPCSSRCGPGTRSRTRRRLCSDCRPRQQRQRQPCRGPCWAGRPRPYTQRPPTARPRHRPTTARPAPSRVKRELGSQEGTVGQLADGTQPTDDRGSVGGNDVVQVEPAVPERGIDQQGPAISVEVLEQVGPAMPDGPSEQLQPVIPEVSGQLGPAIAGESEQLRPTIPEVSEQLRPTIPEASEQLRPAISVGVSEQLGPLPEGGLDQLGPAATQQNLDKPGSGIPGNVPDHAGPALSKGELDQQVSITVNHGGFDQEPASPERKALDYLGPVRADDNRSSTVSPGGSDRTEHETSNRTEDTNEAAARHMEDADEVLVRGLEADGRQVDSEVSAFEHMADKMATFARDLASRAAATVGRLSHQHEALLSSIANSSTVQKAQHRAETARRAAATARRAAANETIRLGELQQQQRQVAAALRAAETAAGQWRKVEARARHAVRSAERQLEKEQERTREVALPSRAAGQERTEERRRLQATVQRLETLLERQRNITEKLQQRAGASSARAGRATRQSALVAERRREVPVEQAAARRSYAELNELRLAAARRRAHLALLRADASVADQQELLGRAAAAATQPPRQRWRPPLPAPPAPVLRLKVVVPEEEQETTTRPSILL